MTKTAASMLLVTTVLAPSACKGDPCKATELYPAAKDLGWNLQDVIAARFERLGKTDFPRAARPK
jgi:hypothetical protein